MSRQLRAVSSTRHPSPATQSGRRGRPGAMANARAAGHRAGGGFTRYGPGGGVGSGAAWRREARDTWEAILAGTELEDQLFTETVECMGITGDVGTVDDHAMLVAAQYIDGAYGTLGRATYCYVSNRTELRSSPGRSSTRPSSPTGSGSTRNTGIRAASSRRAPPPTSRDRWRSRPSTRPAARTSRARRSPFRRRTSVTGKRKRWAPRS